MDSLFTSQIFSHILLTHCSLAYILCARKEQQGSGGRAWEIVRAVWKLCFVTFVSSNVLASMSQNGWYFSTGSLGNRIWEFHGCFLSLVHLFKVRNFSVLSQSTFLVAEITFPKGCLNCLLEIVPKLLEASPARGMIRRTALPTTTSFWPVFSFQAGLPAWGPSFTIHSLFCFQFLMRYEIFATL